MKILNKLSKTFLKIFVFAVIALFVFQPLMAVPMAMAEDDNGDTAIDTGDAAVVIDVKNDVNQNTFAQNPPQDEPLPPEPAADEDSDTLTDSDGAASGQGTGDGRGADETTALTDPADAEEATDETDTDEIGSTADETPQENDSVEVNNNNDAQVDNGLAGNGNTGENEISQNEGDSEITTGDVGIGSAVDNNVNSNTTEAPCEDERGAQDNATTSPKYIDVDNANNASTTNDVDLSGNSGTNTISSTTGKAIITTGDINIFSAIVNFVNTNFFGNGRDFFINIFSHIVGTLDLSGFGDDYLTESGSGQECGAFDCYVNINNSSTSTLENNVTINAGTGINTIASTTGPAIIETGDITILNDIVNVANLNIAGNGWLFAIVNIFGVLEGDIILPPINGQAEGGEAALEFISQAGQNAGQATELIVANTNFADVLNNIEVEANTGENIIASSSGGNIIHTGSAAANIKALNLVNINYTGNGWKFTQINLFGSWDGLVHSLPPGYSYYEDDYGATIYNDFFNDDTFSGGCALLSAANTNHASTTNNVAITADTGANSILHSESGGTISTGDIFIGSNLLNFINSGFTGDNWEFSMINVFGDWQGNLSFGQPDLWITESVSPEGPAAIGDYVTYTFLFGNSGDGLATNVIIEDDFNEAYMNVAQAAGGSNDGGVILWNLGQLPPNSQGSVSYTAQVKDDIAYGKNESQNTANISSSEGDRDYANNSAGGTIFVDGGAAPASGGGFRAANFNSGGPALPSLAIVKTNDAGGIVHPGDKVNYQITIKNTGGALLYDVLAVDVMTDETGEIEVNRDFWDLEIVYDGEEIIIDYTIEIEPNIKSGTYTNEVMVEGFDQTRGIYISAIASSKIKVENPNYEYEENPVVLGKEGMPQLEASKISRKSFVNPGDSALFELIITNNGNLTAFEVLVSENLPNGLVFSDSGSMNKQWNLSDIAPGEFKNIEYSISADKSLAPGIYTIAAKVQAANNNPISAEVDLEIRAATVKGAELASTGFSVKEFVVLILALAMLSGFVVMLRKRYI